MAAIECTKCGAEVSEHALYCPKCGKAIPQPFSGKSPADSKVGTIVGVVGCLVILAGLIVVFILLMASID